MSAASTLSDRHESYIEAPTGLLQNYRVQISVQFVLDLQVYNLPVPRRTRRVRLVDGLIFGTNSLRVSPIKFRRLVLSILEVIGVEEWFRNLLGGAQPVILPDLYTYVYEYDSLGSQGNTGTRVWCHHVGYEVHTSMQHSISKIDE